ncbi:MAG: trypsin-like peptidase domain-containing protein [Krumholzibacteria bacterium]|nr:trypsin-like peptidase domain-containing protein [Candidatus Krumholzibacteria bacterium]
MKLIVEYAGPEPVGKMIADRIGTPGGRSGQFDKYQLTIDELIVDVETDPHRRQVPSRYVAGSKIIANPDYVRLEGELRAASDRHSYLLANPPARNSDTMSAFLYGQYQGKLANAEREVFRLRERLGRTEATIEVDDVRPYEYTEMRTQIFGTLAVTLRPQEDMRPSEGIRAAKTIDEFAVSRIGVQDGDMSGAKNEAQIVPTDEVLTACLAAEVVADMRRGLARRYVEKLIAKPGLPPGEAREVGSAPGSAAVDAAESWLFDNPRARPIEVRNSTPSLRSIKDAVQYAECVTYRVIAVEANYSAKMGTAYIVDAYGRCVTNAHVVEGASFVFLTKGEGSAPIMRLAGIVAVDPTRDLALLEVNGLGEGDQAVAIDFADEVDMGEEVFYVGYPASPILDRSEAFFARGIVSQVLREANGRVALYMLDITANPGASGSGIISYPGGRLIGTLSWGFGRSISIDELLQVLGGGAIRIKESENYCTSASQLGEFLESCGLR